MDLYHNFTRLDGYIDGGPEGGPSAAPTTATNVRDFTWTTSDVQVWDATSAVVAARGARLLLVKHDFGRGRRHRLGGDGVSDVDAHRGLQRGGAERLAAVGFDFVQAGLEILGLDVGFAMSASSVWGGPSWGCVSSRPGLSAHPKLFTPGGDCRSAVQGSPDAALRLGPVLQRAGKGRVELPGPGGPARPTGLHVEPDHVRDECVFLQPAPSHQKKLHPLRFPAMGLPWSPSRSRPCRTTALVTPLPR